MKAVEIVHLLIALVVIAALMIAPVMFGRSTPTLSEAIVFAFIILLVTVAAKKAMALMLESEVEHQLWTLSQWGLHKQDHFKKPLPIGILLPVIVSLFSFGAVKLMAVLTYETTPKKTRAVRAFGTHTYSSMTDWHNALIGAAGITSVLLLALFAYFLPYNAEPLARLAIFYACSNMLPISKLDGIQILFGSRVLWVTLAVITIIFTGYALTVV